MTHGLFFMRIRNRDVEMNNNYCKSNLYKLVPERTQCTNPNEMTDAYVYSLQKMTRSRPQGFMEEFDALQRGRN